MALPLPSPNPSPSQPVRLPSTFPLLLPGHSPPDSYKSILNGLPASSPGPHPPGPFGPSIQQLLSAEEKVSSYGKIPSGEI
ncbi:hypothetical protein CapIbe_012386 [Capra ibex]